MAIKSKNTKINPTVTVRGFLSYAGLIVATFFIVASVFVLTAVAVSTTLSEDLSITLALFGESRNFFYEHMEIVIRLCSFIALVSMSLVFTFLFKEHRKSFEKMVAQSLGKVWVEIKISISLLLLFIALYFENPFLFVFFATFILFLILTEFTYHQKPWGKNIIFSVLKKANSMKGKPKYYKISTRRFFSTTIIISVILVIATISIRLISNYLPSSLGLLTNYTIVFNVSIAIAAAASIIGTLLWHVITTRADLTDLMEITDQIEAMYHGNLNAVNNVPPTSNFYNSAMQLNMIQTGIQKAVDEGIKADRTKVELITNVSHDIKTPLTSIISYVDLLQKERSLPDHIKDYINTLAQKADRLSNIVQDVFDVSKAATGNIALNLEVLDLVKLLEQTLAEMDETMDAAPIEWRVDLGVVPILINTDGQKLYRVFQNLVRNCAQYALEGSRAYIQLDQRDNAVYVTVRNISRDELDVSSVFELTERFVRGDRNRTREGSGLGLSIAKSFTEACGGKFSLRTDGDIFMITTEFQVLPAEMPFVLEPIIENNLEMNGENYSDIDEKTDSSKEALSKNVENPQVENDKITEISENNSAVQDKLSDSKAEFSTTTETYVETTNSNLNAPVTSAALSAQTEALTGTDRNASEVQEKLPTAIEKLSHFKGTKPIGYRKSGKKKQTDSKLQNSLPPKVSTSDVPEPDAITSISKKTFASIFRKIQNKK